MASITRYLSTKKNLAGESEIFLRVTLSRISRFRIPTGLFINPSKFDNGKIKKPRIANEEYENLRNIESKLIDIESRISDASVRLDSISKQDLLDLVDKYHKPVRHKPTVGKSNKSEFFDMFYRFVSQKNVTMGRKERYLSFIRILKRYEIYKQSQNGKFRLMINKFDVDALTDFMWYFYHEHELYDQFVDKFKSNDCLFCVHNDKRRPRPRGNNVGITILNGIGAFFNWLIEEGKATHNPVSKYKGSKVEKYGTPVYLTKEERDIVANFDLSANPRLAKQRDVFIFQCHIGCRVSDMYDFTEANITGGAIEYIPGKTKNDRLNTVRVPLTSTAQAILDRYEDEPTLLPLISQQKYNEAIKEVCKACGIDRVVTVINPTTGKDERKPIWQVASSHMARRTFIGNLYKQVKDPNLVGALSGHKEGSRAFARYREIDDDIRREMMDLLE